MAGRRPQPGQRGPRSKRVCVGNRPAAHHTPPGRGTPGCRGDASPGRKLHSDRRSVSNVRTRRKPAAVPRATGIHHVQLALPEGAEAVARHSYGGVLGWTELPKPTYLAARGGLWYRVGSQEFHLGIEPEFQPARKAHPAILVDDLDGLRRRLTDEGVQTVDDQPLPGYRRFYARDPFGNRLEFLVAEVLPEPPSG